MSCITLTRENQDLIAKANRECCFEETRDHIEDAEFDVEGERDQETSGNPYSFPASTSEDSTEEAQEDIQPPD